MYSRNCSSPLRAISVAHAVFASNASRLAKTIEAALTTANGVVLELDHSYNEFLELAVRAVGSDADANVIEIYAARGVSDDYVYVASVAATVGTAIVRGGTKLWCDTLAVTEKDAGFEVVSSGEVGANEQAHVWINTNGYNRFLFIASTLASTSLVVEHAAVNRRNIPAVA